MSLRAGSWLVWPAALVLLTAVGCGGNNGARDAGSDASDARAEAPADTATAPDVGIETGADVAHGLRFSGDAIDAPNDGGGDATTDAPADTVSDATDAPSVTDAPSEEVPPPPPPMLTVEATQHAIVLDGCTGFTLAPATLMDVTAGAAHHRADREHAVEGERFGRERQPDSRPSTTTSSCSCRSRPATPASRRFFMLNGVGAMKNFTLSAAGAVRLMFIDSDATYNAGQATVRLDTTGPSRDRRRDGQRASVEHGLLLDRPHCSRSATARIA